MIELDQESSMAKALKVIAIEHLKTALNRYIKNINIDIDTKEINYTLKYYKFEKTFKFKVADYIKDSAEDTYRRIIASDMLKEGYLLVPIEGGHIVRCPTGEEYELGAETCTCAHFENMQVKRPCKHLNFRDFFFQYRSAVGKAKREIELNTVIK